MAPPRKDLPPHLNFAPLQNATDALTRSADRYQKALDKVTGNGELKISGDSLKSLNELLLQSERKLTSDEACPDDHGLNT